MGVNQEVIEKAVLDMTVLGNGGKLNPEQANAFIDKIVEKPTIINECRVVKMAADTRKVEKIGFGQRVLHPGVEGTDPGEAKYVAPTTSTVTLAVKEFIAVVKITDDSLENNIEGASLDDHVINLLAERCSLDMEEIILNGDTTHATDEFLQQLDGLRKMITSHKVDQASAVLEKATFKNAKKKLPNKYLRNPREWRFFTSHNIETDWVDIIGERATPAGDDAIISGLVRPAFGIPVKGIAMLQDYDNGMGVDVSDSILIHPKNILLGIQRDIRIETERKPRERATYIVLTLKMDVKLEEEDATVLIEKIKA